MVTYDATWKTAEESLEILTVDDLSVPIKAAVTYRSTVNHLRDLHITVGPAFL